MKNIFFLLNINYYLFNKVNFYNKIIHEKILYYNKSNKLIEIYYNDLKKSFLTFNPFYGIEIDNYFIKNVIYKKKIKNVKKEKKFIIPYLDLTYIFNLSIEKIRIKK